MERINQKYIEILEFNNNNIWEIKDINNNVISKIIVNDNYHKYTSSLINDIIKKISKYIS